MSSGETSVFERLWKLEASANKLVLDGKRDPEDLCALLQGFVYGKGLPEIDWRRVYGELGMPMELDHFFAERVGEGAIVRPDLWVVPVVRGVTANKLVSVLRKLGVGMSLYGEDLDRGVQANVRDPNEGSYVIAFRRTVEADDEFKNLSADQLKACDHKGITLVERLLLELGYFLATGKHLDEKNWTLCSDSRDCGGDVPSVSWNPGHRKVHVRWDFPSYSGGNLRSRSAIPV